MPEADHGVERDSVHWVVDVARDRDVYGLVRNSSPTPIDNECRVLLGRICCGPASVKKNRLGFGIHILEHLNQGVNRMSHWNV